MSTVRIFSYLPNPRVWKSLIAAELCGVSVEVVGAKPRELGGWLWDYDARPLEDEDREQGRWARTGKRGFSGTLHKTDAFLNAHPFGTVPAAFGDGGSVGIFESNSILRAVVRQGAGDHGLYGNNAWQASRIDSFLDANLVFAREAQVYLLGMDAISEEAHARMQGAYEFYLDGVERALSEQPFIASSQLTMADISFTCDVAQFMREQHYEESLQAAGLDTVSGNMAQEFPRSHTHLLTLSAQPPFADWLTPYLCWYTDR